MSFNLKFIPNNVISLPELSDKEKSKFIQSGKDVNDYKLDYKNYSVFQNPFRKFAYYSVANIDGSLFVPMKRKGSWSNDIRLLGNEQYGEDLYRALNQLNYNPDKKCEYRVNCPIDRGHMTKREDVQWSKGKIREKAEEAAKSTFVYTNSVPQHYRLNQTIWRYIEDYILHKETIVNAKKVTVFTGPILSENDPYALIEIDSEKVQLPVLFWKVIYYLDSQNQLCRTAFVTNQSQLLVDSNIVSDVTRYSNEEDSEDYKIETMFLGFREARTYQVNVKMIENLSHLTFKKAKEHYTDTRSQELVLEDTEVRSFEGFDVTGHEGFEIEGDYFKSINITNLTL